VSETGSVVYMMNKIGPRTEPRGTLQISRTVVDRAVPRRTCWVRPVK